MTLKVFLLKLLLKLFLIVILQNAGEHAGEQLKLASHIIFMIKEHDLLWVPNFIALGIYFLFRTKFSWNEGIDTCFNVECVLLGRNLDFLGGYLVVNARYVVVTTGYCALLVVTARFHFQYERSQRC